MYTFPPQRTSNESRFMFAMEQTANYEKVHNYFIICTAQCRWMKSWGINMASEARQRQVMRADLDKMIIVYHFAFLLNMVVRS